MCEVDAGVADALKEPNHRVVICRRFKRMVVSQEGCTFDAGIQCQWNTLQCDVTGDHCPDTKDQLQERVQSQAFELVVSTSNTFSAVKLIH